MDKGMKSLMMMNEKLLKKMTTQLQREDLVEEFKKIADRLKK